MPTANFVESILFYDDDENTSNPQRKHVDWRRSSSGARFDQVYSERFLLSPGVEKVLETSLGETDLSATPVAVQAVTAQSTWYQFRGAFPTSPWASALAVSAQSLTLTVQVDGTLLVTGTGLASLSAVVPGDWVYIAGSQYGDTGPFSSVNQGFWEVVSVAAGLTLRSVYGTTTPVNETVTTTSVNNLQLVRKETRPRWLFVQGSAVYAGLQQVVGAGIGWLAVLAPSQYVAVASISLTLIAAPIFIAYARVESDQPVTVKLTDAVADNEVSLLPSTSVTPVWVEVFPFGLALSVENTGSNVAAAVNIIYAFSADPS